MRGKKRMLYECKCGYIYVYCEVLPKLKGKTLILALNYVSGFSIYSKFVVSFFSNLISWKEIKLEYEMFR